MHLLHGAKVQKKRFKYVLRYDLWHISILINCSTLVRTSTFYVCTVVLFYKKTVIHKDYFISIVYKQKKIILEISKQLIFIRLLHFTVWLVLRRFETFFITSDIFILLCLLSRLKRR